MGDMRNSKALVLIPCCKEKRVSADDYSVLASPVPGIEPLRLGLISKLQKTPTLADKRENREGILNAQAPRTAASSLYQGELYNQLKNVWRQNAAEILIVSAAYGLVRFREARKEYELQMGDRFTDKQPVYEYWQQAGLSGLLEDYIRTNEISHVWSLLPDSLQVGAPYHRVFRQYWRRANSLGQTCFWVKVFKADEKGHSVGSGSGGKRGEWLAAVLKKNPEVLTENDPAKRSFEEIPGFNFKYSHC